MALPRELDIDPRKPFNKAVLDGAFEYLYAQLRSLQGFQPDWVEELNNLRNFAYARLDEAIVPVYQSLTAIAHLGAMFTALSSSNVVVGAGSRTFSVAADDRLQFAPAGYLQVRSLDDPAVVLFGSTSSYVRDTGVLVVAIDQFAGTEGAEVAGWRISAAATPNIAAYTQGQIDNQIAQQVASATSGLAPKVSPSFSGTPNAPTPPDGANSTQIANAAFVQAAISAAINSAFGGGGTGPATFGNPVTFNDVATHNKSVSLLGSGTELIIRDQDGAGAYHLAVVNGNLNFRWVPTDGGAGEGTAGIKFQFSQTGTLFLTDFQLP